MLSRKSLRVDHAARLSPDASYYLCSTFWNLLLSLGVVTSQMEAVQEQVLCNPQTPTGAVGPRGRLMLSEHFPEELLICVYMKFSLCYSEF